MSRAAAPVISVTPAANLRGIALMTLAMLGFAVTDMFIKLLAGSLATGQILIILGAGGAMLFAALAVAQGERIFTRGFFEPAVLTRNLFEIVGTFGFVTAITLSPLSTASAIIQANPLIVTLGAALLLKEPVGPRRWAAIGIGLIGVLLVIQPWSAGFAPASLFAVLAVFGLAFRDLATRRVTAAIPTAVLSVYALTMLVPLGAVMLALPAGGDWTAPSLTDTATLAVAIATSAAAYFAITAAMRVGDVGIVTPFRYTRIVFALVIAALVFGERIDPLTYLGATIVVATGLYTLWRTQRAAALSSPSPPR